ncbi:hypothetical protein MKW94_005531 [Papaver nudicaule]|uniref:GED domain-containing protein n=1 Tax=Papaver nudicaule TaxID=74823 RepID=A0AA41SER6_PAPNU|nr:hypothetical protein [Papaver nudicaule]
MRLQNHASSGPKLQLEFRKKCISNTPLTLVINKNGVLDLTMINSIIMEYIVPKESIILNVLSASKVNKTGERTLAVVTNVYKSPEVAMLAQKVVQIQATSTVKFLPDMVQNINDKLNKNMLDDFSADLETKSVWNSNKDEETKGIRLPKFLPRTAFQTILQRRIDIVVESPAEFVEKAWNYVEDVFVHSFIRWAAHNLIKKVRAQSIERVKEIVEMEKITDYSCSPVYTTTWTRLILQQQQQFKVVMNNKSKAQRLPFKMLGEVEFGHLQDTQIVGEAFVIKMRIMAYWKIVMRRLVNSLALHLVFTIQNLINKDMQHEVVKELMSGPSGGRIGRMSEESPSAVGKREKLNRNIKLLRESKDVVAKFLDRISAMFKEMLDTRSSGVYGDGSLLKILFHFMSCFWFLDLV